MRLSDLSQEEESDRTMLINFEKDGTLEEAASDRTMKIKCDRDEISEEEASDRTMMIDLGKNKGGGEDHLDRTMMIDLGKSGAGEGAEYDRTMMIDLDRDRDALPEGTDRTMLIHMNRQADEEPEIEARVHPPSESKTARYAKVVRPGESKSRTSSLPLSMSKADESRHTPMGDPRKRSSVKRTLSGGSSPMEEMRNENPLWAWTRAVHPTRGGLAALLCFPVSGLAFVNIAFSWMIPDHPGPLPIVGSDAFVSQYLVPDLATGFLLWFIMAMLAQILYSGAGGRPPLLWTLKIMVFALLPFALVRLGWMGVHVLMNGPESFLRGYRPPWASGVTPVLYFLTGALTVFMLSKAASSVHCQAHEKRALFSFSLIPILFLTGHIAFMQIQGWRFEQRIGPAWRRAESAWSESRSREALPLLEEVLDYPRILTPSQKARFYQMRGELRLQEGLVLKAREDFIRTVQLLPPSHAENRMARAANLLALDRVDLARVQLQIAEEMRPASANVHRWLARLALGDFDPELKNPALAIDYARQAVALEPSAPNKALLERTERALSPL
ncbi:MAG: hypothetical protein JJU05_06745 [Verrucomicrobia bacterium]|nr:hypothetical protein [Verrucomicrobiota bacterium]MCH8527055.1 hypothetical protein [Kiritimatiellia bacterium]